MSDQETEDRNLLIIKLSEVYRDIMDDAVNTNSDAQFPLTRFVHSKIAREAYIAQLLDLGDTSLHLGENLQLVWRVTTDQESKHRMVLCKVIGPTHQKLRYFNRINSILKSLGMLDHL